MAAECRRKHAPLSNKSTCVALWGSIRKMNGLLEDMLPRRATTAVDPGLSPSDHRLSLLHPYGPFCPPISSSPFLPAATATASTPVTAVLGMKAGEPTARAKAVPLQFHFHSHSEHLLDGGLWARVGYQQSTARTRAPAVPLPQPLPAPAGRCVGCEPMDSHSVASSTRASAAPLPQSHSARAWWTEGRTGKLLVGSQLCHLLRPRRGKALLHRLSYCSSETPATGPPLIHSCTLPVLASPQAATSPWSCTLCTA